MSKTSSIKTPRPYQGGQGKPEESTTNGTGPR